MASQHNGISTLIHRVDPRPAEKAFGAAVRSLDEMARAGGIMRTAAHENAISLFSQAYDGMAALAKACGSDITERPPAHTEQKVTWIDPFQIDNFHLQLEVYGSESLDPDFLDSLEAGIVNPLIVAALPEERYVVLSGSRRKNGARMRGIKLIPCIVHYGLSDLQMQKVFLRSNEQRLKTNEQKIREAAAWEKIFAAEAEVARLANLKQNSQKLPISATDIPIEDADHRCPPGRTSETQAENHRNSQRSGDRAAEIVGISADTLARGKPVVDAIKAAEDAGDKVRAQELLTTLNEKGVKPAARMLTEAAASSQAAATDLRDQLGILVPIVLRPHFKYAEQMRQSMSDISKLKSKITREFNEIDGFKDFDLRNSFELKNVQHMLASARNALERHAPYCQCPRCGGTPAMRNIAMDDRCSACRGTGFITKDAYDGQVLTEEDKNKLEAMK